MKYDDKRHMSNMVRDVRARFGLLAGYVVLEDHYGHFPKNLRPMDWPYFDHIMPGFMQKYQMEQAEEKRQKEEKEERRKRKVAEAEAEVEASQIREEAMRSYLNSRWRGRV